MGNRRRSVTNNCRVRWTWPGAARTSCTSSMPTRPASRSTTRKATTCADSVRGAPSPDCWRTRTVSTSGTTACSWRTRPTIVFRSSRSRASARTRSACTRSFHARARASCTTLPRSRSRRTVRAWRSPSHWTIASRSSAARPEPSRPRTPCDPTTGNRAPTTGSTWMRMARGWWRPNPNRVAYTCTTPGSARSRSGSRRSAVGGAGCCATAAPARWMSTSRHAQCWCATRACASSKRCNWRSTPMHRSDSTGASRALPGDWTSSDCSARRPRPRS